MIHSIWLMTSKKSLQNLIKIGWEWRMEKSAKKHAIQVNVTVSIERGRDSYLPDYIN